MTTSEKKDKLGNLFSALNLKIITKQNKLR